MKIIGINFSSAHSLAIADVLPRLPDIAKKFTVILSATIAPADFQVLEFYFKKTLQLLLVKAVKGSPVGPGCIYFPPEGYTLSINNQRIELTSGIQSTETAGNMLFESLAKEFGVNAIGVILQTQGKNEYKKSIENIENARGQVLIQYLSENKLPGESFTGNNDLSHLQAKLERLLTLKIIGESEAGAGNYPEYEPGTGMAEEDFRPEYASHSGPSDNLYLHPALYRHMLDDNSVGFVIIDESYTIRYCNTAGKKLFGRINTVDMVLGTVIHRLFPHPTPADVAEAMHAAFNNKVTETRHLFIDSNKDPLWLEFKTAPLYTGNSAEYVSINIRDVTDEEAFRLRAHYRNNYFSSLLISNTTYLVRIDLEGNYSYVNNAFCKKIGVVAEEFIGSHYSATIHPEDIPICEEAAYKALANPSEPVNYEIRKKMSSGEYFHSEWEIIVVQNEAGTAPEIQAVGRDITERVEAGKKLRFEKERLAKIIETIGTPIVLMTVKEKYVVFYNEAFLKLFEITPFDIQRHDITKFYSCADEIDKVLAAVRETGEVKDMELQLVSAGGKQLTVLLSAKTLDYFGDEVLYSSFIDISEIKIQRDKNKFNSEMLANVSDALVATDLEGKVIYYNKGAEKIYGYNRKEILGKSLEILYPNQDFSAFAAHISDILKGEDYVGEWCGINKWGQPFDIYIKTTVFKNTEGQVIGFIGMAKDITEKKRQEQALQESAQLLKKLTDSVPGAIYQFEMSPEGKFSFPFVSDGIKYFHGSLTAQKLKRRPELAFSVVHPDDIQLLKNSIEESARTLGVWDIEYRVPQQNGEIHWHRGVSRPEVKPDGTRVWYGFFQDITTTKLLRDLTEESINRFTSFADNSPVAFYICESNGDIVYANKQFGLIMNKPDEAVPGGNIYTLFDKVFSDSFRNSAAEVITGNRTLSEEIEVPINGKSIFLLLTNFPIKYALGKTVIGAIGVDITDKKKQEHELVLRERRLTSILNSGSHFIIRGDLRARFTFVNQAYEKTFGKTMDDLAGESAFRFVHPDDIFKLLRTIKRCMVKLGASVQTQLRKIDRLGVVVQTLWEFVAIEDFEGNVYEIQAVGWDITAIEKQKEEIKNLALVAKKTKNAVIITDKKNNTEWVNEGFTRITGYTLEDIKHRKPGHLLQGPETNKTTVEYISRCIKEGKGFKAEIINYNKSGDKYWLLIEAEPIFDDNGNLIKFIAIETDITEKKEQEFEKEKLISELMVKNENLEEFSYIISHNLRGPVANIVGLVNIFRWDNPMETNKTILSSLVKTAQQLDEVLTDVNRIISYRQNLNETKEKIQIKTILSAVLESFREELLPVEFRFINNFDPKLEIFSIKAYLQSIFHNLVSNAIKYRTPGTKLVLTFESHTIGNYVELLFIDNGLGINLNLYKDSVFMLYKRFHSHVQGKGLGLFMTKQQVQLLGGTIEVESNEGEGSMFIIRLPMADN